MQPNYPSFANCYQFAWMQVTGCAKAKLLDYVLLNFHLGGFIDRTELNHGEQGEEKRRTETEKIEWDWILHGQSRDSTQNVRLSAFLRRYRRLRRELSRCFPNDKIMCNIFAQVLRHTKMVRFNDENFNRNSCDYLFARTLRHDVSSLSI